MMRHRVPDACVERLSLYVRELSRLKEEETIYVSSRRLAVHLRLTDAQVRRDLSYFGQFGTSGRGYQVDRLLGALSQVLGIRNRAWNAALVGVGNLGSALLAYRGFRERGIVIKIAADVDARKVGRVVQGLTVVSADRLAERVRRQRIHIGMIAVPSDAAQRVCDQLVAGGVRAIVNFAPTVLEVPPSIRLRNVDLALELEALAFHLVSARNGAPIAR